MGRWSFNLAGALSLLLFAAMLLLWARSHAGETILVESAPGQLLFIGIDGPASVFRISCFVLRFPRYCGRYAMICRIGSR